MSHPPSDDSPDASAILDGLAADAERLADRVVTPSLWFYPVLAAAAALMVAAPAVEESGFSVMLLGLAGLAFALIAQEHHKRTGVTVRFGAAPKSVVLAAVVSAVLAGLLVTSFSLANAGLHSRVFATSMAAFLVTLVGSFLADRVHRAELRRGR